MSGIAKVSHKMKKKISLNDYAALEQNPASSSEETPKSRKIYSLSHKESVMLEKIFSKRVNSETPSSIPQIMSEAIRLLYTQEFTG